MKYCLSPPEIPRAQAIFHTPPLVTIQVQYSYFSSDLTLFIISKVRLFSTFTDLQPDSIKSFSYVNWLLGRTSEVGFCVQKSFCCISGTQCQVNFGNMIISFSLKKMVL